MEEVDEILSCKDQPVLEAYMDTLFRAAVRLWKFVMPVESREVFQTQVFHPASASEELQRHLGMTRDQRLLEMYYLFDLIDFTYVAYLKYFAYFHFSWGGRFQYGCPPSLAKAKSDRDASAAGSFTGVEYDMLLHFSIAHLCSVDGALPDFPYGAKALDFFRGKGLHRYIFCIYVTYFVYFAF